MIRPWLTAVVFLSALAALAPGANLPGHIYFDETWYVPTAREWLDQGEMLHPEHPPLAKMLIAAGMKAFGDNPWGWRIAPLVFGALTVTAVWGWALALTGEVVLALYAAALTLLDGIVFVQARIAMLDIFLMAFCMLALAAFTWAERERALRWHLIAGLCLGLAAACKWSGWFLAAGLVAYLALKGLMGVWRVRFEDARDADFYQPGARGLSVAGGLAAYVAAPLLAYCLSYVPQLIHAHSVYEFIATHKNMIAIMTGSSSDHPYKSMWWTWPGLWRPVWYLFDTPDKAADHWTQAAAIVGLPNPLVLFPGEIAMVWTVYAGLIRRARAPLIVLVAFASQWLVWAANPKGLEFYYYYYPSILCLGPALALFAQSLSGWRRGVFLGLTLLGAAGMFIFFLPVFAAGIGVNPSTFEARVWLPTWR